MIDGAVWHCKTGCIYQSLISLPKRLDRLSDYLLIFESAPKTLNKDVIQVSTLAIHADLDPVAGQNEYEFI